MTTPSGVLRSRSGLWMTEPAGPSCVTLVLGDTRYWGIGPSTRTLLLYLADQSTGMSVREAQAAYPQVNLDQLVTNRLVHYLPPDGQTPPRALVLEMWRRNLRSRQTLSRSGLHELRTLMQPRMTAPDHPWGGMNCRRPLVFDHIEAATRLSFAIPGAARKCTVVAHATCLALRAHGFDAYIAFIGTAGQNMMHARAMVAAETIDPNDDLLEADSFQPIGLHLLAPKS